jgi:predicted transcriptional regulator
MNCDRCGDEIPAGEAHEHAGQNLCDDCYMDVMTPQTGCDPWAVYTATRLRDQEPTLTRTQEIIVGLVQDGGRASMSEVLEATGLDEAGLRRELVTLRHMELVGFERRSDGGVDVKEFVKHHD